MESAFQSARRLGTYSEVKICSCCMLLLANGECCDGSDDDVPCGTPERLAAYVMSGTSAGTHYITLGTVTDDCEHNLRDDAQADAHTENCERFGFSWDPCDTCGSNLGGDRYAATVWPINDNQG